MAHDPQRLHGRRPRASVLVGVSVTVYARLASQAAPSPVGPMTMYLYALEPVHADVHYAVGYADIPATYTGRLDVSAGFNGARDAMLQSQPGARVHCEQRVSLGMNPGREFESAIPGKGLSFVRIYLVGRRLYMVGVIGKKVKWNSKEVQEFFDSFEVAGVSVETAAPLAAAPPPAAPAVAEREPEPAPRGPVLQPPPRGIGPGKLDPRGRTPLVVPVPRRQAK